LNAKPIYNIEGKPKGSTFSFLFIILVGHY